MTKLCTRCLDYIEKIILTTIGIMLMIMTGAIFYQVILRYIFGNSNVWAEELTRYLFVWVTFLGSAVAIRRSKHLTIDYFINLFRPKAKAMLQIIIYLSILVFLSILLKNSIILVLNTTSTLSPGMMIPMAVPYAAVTVGTVLMILYSVELILKQLAIIKHCKVNEQENQKLNRNINIIKEG